MSKTFICPDVPTDYVEVFVREMSEFNRLKVKSCVFVNVLM